MERSQLTDRFSRPNDQRRADKPAASFLLPMLDRSNIFGSSHAARVLQVTGAICRESLLLKQLLQQRSLCLSFKNKTLAKR